MKASIVLTSFGVFAFDDENRLLSYVCFPKSFEEAAKKISEAESGKLFREASDLVERLKGLGYKSFSFENEGLAAEVREKLGVECHFSRASSAGELLRSKLADFAVKVGFVKDYEEFNGWLRSVAVELSRLKVKRAVEKRDLTIAQAIQTLDDLDKTINLFMSRLREWYGIHFPELDRLIDKHETYTRLVLNIGFRSGFTVERLEKDGLPRIKAEQIAKSAETSMGADLAEQDLRQIQALCRNILNLYDLRQSLEAYIENTMEEVAPNIKALTGPLLGARLIALAGSLTNLAKMPASTLQVLGAEKALFRSLKTGTRPPKHGIIFQHPLLHEAKKWQRGKIARAIAGKLAIAARTDVFGGRYIGEELRADVERRINEIREKYPEPQKIPEKKPKKLKKWRKKKHAR
ncbi:MAG: C/D box methylation guide ribonucleoprotein complex aNOP56 subunit [Candidatus Bathyarchaeia archaeon]